MNEDPGNDEGDLPIPSGGEGVDLPMPGAAPEPEAAARIPRPPAQPVIRMRTELVCRIPELGGHILFYEKSRMFFAYCGNIEHGRCIMTRTCERSLRSGREAQGRPLGHLAAWLRGHDLASKLDHSLQFPDHATRLAAREEWRQRDPAFAVLEELERPRSANEGEELLALP